MPSTTVKRRPRGRSAQIAIKAKKVQEVIDLSETKLIQVLKGQTNLPEKLVVNVALELYKRRVPSKVESDSSGDKITMIKVIKNHVPDSPNIGKTDTIDMVEAEVEKVLDGRSEDIIHPETDPSS